MRLHRNKKGPNPYKIKCSRHKLKLLFNYASYFVILALSLSIIYCIKLSWDLEECQPDAAAAATPNEVFWKVAAEDLACNYGSQPLVTPSRKVIAKTSYTFMDSSGYDCCYQSIGYDDTYSNKLKVISQCKQFAHAAYITEPYIKVKCSLNGSVLYQEIFLFAYNMPRTPHNSRGILNGRDVVGGTNERGRKPFNVLLLILGHISRRVFHGALRKTAKILADDLRAVEFTYLQGHVEDPHENLRKFLLNTDSRPIWIDFRRSGFRTAYAQDCSESQTELVPPHTDRDRFYPFDYNWAGFYGISREYTANQALSRKCPYCLGSTKSYVYLLDYIKQALRDSDGKHPLFGIFYTEIFKHYADYLYYADDDFAAFFQFVHRHFSRQTFVLFLGDNIVKDDFGGKSVPFFYFVLPDGFLKEVPGARESLIRNSGRMKTYADIRSTLYDLIDPYNLDSTSLFTTEMAEQSCAAANVDETICMCH